MKAEELFEKLGYKKQVGFESICFIYENEDTVNFEIIFDLKNKTIHTHGACSDKSVSMDELKSNVKNLIGLMKKFVQISVQAKRVNSHAQIVEFICMI